MVSAPRPASDVSAPFLEIVSVEDSVAEAVEPGEAGETALSVSVRLPPTVVTAPNAARLASVVFWLIASAPPTRVSQSSPVRLASAVVPRIVNVPVTSVRQERAARSVGVPVIDRLPSMRVTPRKASTSAWVPSVTRLATNVRPPLHAGLPGWPLRAAPPAHPAPPRRPRSPSLPDLPLPPNRSPAIAPPCLRHRPRRPYRAWRFRRRRRPPPHPRRRRCRRRRRSRRCPCAGRCRTPPRNLHPPRRRRARWRTRANPGARRGSKPWTASATHRRAVVTADIDVSADHADMLQKPFSLAGGEPLVVSNDDVVVDGRHRRQGAQARQPRTVRDVEAFRGRQAVEPAQRRERRVALDVSRG